MMSKTCVAGLMLIILVTGCAPRQSFVATLPPTQAANILPTQTPSLTFTPSDTPTATSTPTDTPTVTPSFTPTQTDTPTATLTDTPTATFTPSQTASPIPTATFEDPAQDPNYTPPPTWTPPPVDPVALLDDHFHLRRPIASTGVNWVDRGYPYGTGIGGRPIHHGVEFQNPAGTPVLAAAAGVVHYAGDDLAVMYGPQFNYYGNVVVIQHAFTSPQGEPVYTLYGHLSRVEVTTGQQVAAGDEVGKVGGTGVALGPHLHFEVRLADPTDFYATRNPELWLFPYQGYGTIAGVVTDSAGAVLQDVVVQVDRAQGERGTSRYTYSYEGDSINPDAAFGENFTMGDLPADYYLVTVRENGRLRFQKVVYVVPNRITWVDVRLN